MRLRGIHAYRFAATFIITICSILTSGAARSNPEEACGSTSTAIPLPDPVSGRKYEIYIQIPSGYREGSKRAPLLVLADGGRAFAKRACEVRELVRKTEIEEEPFVVGLSYAEGESLENSRRRDYTPTPINIPGRTYGGAAAYRTYIRDVVLKYVEQKYSTDPTRRIYWGHSYGGLLGSYILLTEPDLFQTYLLGSPSFWFDDKSIYQFEGEYAQRSTQLKANVFLYVGGKETSRYDLARKGLTRDMVSGMHEFEARLRTRKYRGLRLSSKVIPDRDHRSSIRQGFAWALSNALRD